MKATRNITEISARKGSFVYSLILSWATRTHWI